MSNIEFKECPFCGYKGQMKISNVKEKRKRYGINHTIVTITCGGLCTVSLKQAGVDLESALKNAINVWNKRK